MPSSAFIAFDSFEFGTDGDAPILQNRDPAPGSTGHARGKDTYLEIVDDPSGVNLSTVLLEININSGGWQTAYTGATDTFSVPFTGGSSARGSVTDGYSFNIDHLTDYDWGSVIQVRVTAADTVGNVLGPVIYQYQVVVDASAPVITNNIPTGIDVARDTNIEFDITDTESGVDTSSLNTEVDGDDAIVDGVFQTPDFDGTITDMGGGVWHVLINPGSDFYPESVISVNTSVKDNYGNQLTDFNWPFTIEELYDPGYPYITSSYPLPNSSIQIHDPFISFFVGDEISGINISSVIVEVGGDVAYSSGVTQPGFYVEFESFPHLGELGTVYDYKFRIKRDEPFDVLEEVTVEVYCEDNGDPKSLSFSWTFAIKVEVPIAVITYDRIDALFGSMIQLDGRESHDPNGMPITFSWSISRKPLGSTLVTLTPILHGDRAISFVPDKIGMYEIQLTVSNGFLTSEAVVASINIGLTQTTCGEGLIPDASFLWNAISDFWNLVEDRKYIESIWSGTMQVIGSDLIALWANDYGKSLDTIRETVPRHWQRFNMWTDLEFEQQRIMVGFTDDGTRGKSGIVDPISYDEIIGQGTDATGETFTATLGAPAGYIAIPGTVKVWLGSEQVAEDDGNGNIIGVEGYGVDGAITYGNLSIRIEENVGVNIWTVALPDVQVTYDASSEETNLFYLVAKSRVKLGDGETANPTQTFNSERTEVLGTGTDDYNQKFTHYLPIPGNSSVLPSTVAIKKGVTTVAIDDGDGNLVSDNPALYNVWGTINYDSAYIELEERNNIFGIGEDPEATYHVDLLDIPLERRVIPFTVKIIKIASDTMETVLAADEDGDGTLTGTGGSGTFDYDTHEFYFTESGGSLADTDELWIEFRTANTDLSGVDKNKNARGRVISINDHGYTINRVYNTPTETVVVVDAREIPGGLTKATWRIPHMLHVPSINLESYNVCNGDVIVFEVKRRDIGLTGELRAQVIGVDRDRIGFEFTLGDLTPKGDVIDRGQFEQLVQDLRIVPPSSSTEVVESAANTLISFFPPGVNIYSRPFTPYRITMKAKTIIHNTIIRVHERYMSIPTLQESLYEPEVLRQNWDYVVGDGELRFESGIFTLQDPAPEMLWAECSMIDNAPVVEANFGRIVGITREDLKDKITRVSYISAVKGLWYAIMGGPTVSNIRLGLQILLGLPFAEDTGVIINITENFLEETGGRQLKLARIMVEDIDAQDRLTGRRRLYFYPQDLGLETNPSTGTEYSIGDVIYKWAPISRGVEVVDYVKDPTWWRRALNGLEILKYFTFRAKIDGDIFDVEDAIFAIDFLKKIKPAYTRVITAAFKTLEDDPMDGFEDKISIGGNTALGFYLNVNSFPYPFRTGHRNRHGHVMWNVGSRPFMTVASSLIMDGKTKAGTGGYADKVLVERTSGDSWVHNGGFVQEIIGTGTAGLNDTFETDLTLPAGARVRPGSITIRRNGTGDPSTGDEVGHDDAHGYIFWGTELDGTFNYETAHILIAEKGAPVFAAGETADVDYYWYGEKANDLIHVRPRPDPAVGTSMPSKEGDILVIFRDQPGGGIGSPAFYEIEEITPSDELVLRNYAPSGDPDTMFLGDNPTDVGYIDASSFQYGDNLRCTIIRRIRNPVVSGTDMTKSAATNYLGSSSSKFITDNVNLDDHVIIEDGASSEEYRVSEVRGEDELAVVEMDGTVPSFGADSGLTFRVIKHLMVSKQSLESQSFHLTGPDRVEVEIKDQGGASGPPFDVFTPEMVGCDIYISNSENPANDGTHTITEYVNPGRVVIDATYSLGADDASAEATVVVGPKKTATSWHSGWHARFERMDELSPSEVVEIELTTS